MAFKQFVAWCDERACDGYWGIVAAIACVEVMDEVRKHRFWEREKAWQELNHEIGIEEHVVKPTNQKIKEARQ